MHTLSALGLFARTHRTHARFLIGFATTLLVMAGSALGNLWTADGLRMGPGVLAGIFATYLLIFPLYPIIRRRTNRVRRKSFDAILIGCTALLGVWFGVQEEEAPRMLTEPQMAHAATVGASSTLTATQRTPGQQFHRQVQRGMSLLKLVFRRPARFAEPYELSTGEKIVLTILTILGMIAVGFLVFALSCSISCSGNAVAGALILILGSAAVLTFGILLIVRINRSANWKERRDQRRVEAAERRAHRKSMQ